MPDVRPGPWLKLIAILASAGAALAVVSGALSLHTAHRALAALAVPPLAALVAAAWVAHRRLLGASVAALGLFVAAALVIGRPLHIASPRWPSRQRSSRQLRRCAASRSPRRRGGTT